jgi:hypothetical protein
MNSRNLALIFGIVYLGLAILGMMPGIVTPIAPGAPEMRFDVMHGAVLGLFPVNLLLTLIHLAMGAWGLAAFMGWQRPRVYARSAAFIFAVLGLMGMVQGLDTVFGLMPLYGNDVWLHLLSAGIAGFVAWRPETGERRSISGDRRRTTHAPMSTERRHSTFDRRRSAYLPQA